MEAKLSTWLVRIVINQALKKLRKQKREAGTVALDNVVELEQHLDTTDMMERGPERPDITASRHELRKMLESQVVPAAG